ncbi:ATP-binding protein [Paenibacillus sp. Soil787]|uniref:ATP-binding protein n=1 Tax=Paenibacillus sp. Soil787 TaxID=1736411 RepID=UPI0007032805|nr:ATP-binding protein [Paenibacillus sp. Soil787]KRF27651.1 hypothetical protein ASG93_29350 [Paenibacillus sp. Soil787]
MFGLKCVLQTYNMTNSELAKQLQINRANISMWIKQQDIPLNKLEELKQIFPIIPVELFNKELNSKEELRVQELYITQTDEFEEVEVPIFNEETGEEVWVTKRIYQNEGLIYHLREEQKKIEILEDLQELLQDGPDQYKNEKFIKKLLKILKEENPKQLGVVKMMFYFLNSDNEWGFDPFFNSSKGTQEMYNEVGEILRKYKIIE